MSSTDYALDVKIKDGPTFKEKGSFEMEGYNRIDVVVPQGESLVVNVHAGNLDDIHLLYIKRNDEPQEPENEEDDPPLRKLSYTFGSHTEPIELTDLHVVLGAGAIRLLCEPPNELCFNNEGEQDADVTILVCRETSGPCDPPQGEGEETGDEEYDESDEYGEKGQTPRQEPEQPDEPYGGTPRQEPPKGQYPRQSGDQGQA